MRGATAALSLFFIASLSSVVQCQRPRGVGPEFSKFYKVEETFHCISSPSQELSSSQINDDYCDCPDGSDEPGTSACAHLSARLSDVLVIGHRDLNTSLALPGYYCKNKGHNPKYIPFTHVNDGICDYESCCDGSDEWAGVGGIKCEDRCKEIGKEWKKQDELRQKALGNALKRKKEMIAEASRLRQDTTKKMKDLVSSVAALEARLADSERERDELERVEKTRIVKPAGGGGKLAILVSLTKSRIAELRNALSSMKSQYDRYKTRLNEVEGILATFKSEYNPNFNDEGVKRAVKAWEDYEARQMSTESAVANNDEQTSAEELVSDSEGIDWADFESEAGSGDSELLYQFEAYLPPSVRSWVDQKLRDLRVYLIENGILAAVSDTSSESKALKDARQRVLDIKSDLEKQRRQVEEQREDLNKDYGPDDIFRSLRDQCTALDVGEYTYELCWLGQVTQKPKKGGMQNSMGSFSRLDKIMVDDEIRADGKGLGSGERIVMVHDNGAHCWNGPARSTAVVLACAETEQVWKVTEEEKCVYRMEVGTPAACQLTTSKGGLESALPSKDEL